jgi:uncharacterized RDD family membrane protein YckC
MKSMDQKKSIEGYVHETLHHIQAGPARKERIAADLRAHLQAALESGEMLPAVIERMGSPAELAVAFMSEFPFHYAGFWSRAAAAILDMLVIFIGGGMLAGLGVGIANMVPDRPAEPILWQDLYAGALILLAAGAAFGVLGLILGYFPLLEGRFGTTFGKRLLGLRVLKENGLPIGYKEAFLRRLSFYFEFWPVDALFVFFTEKRQRAMDIVASTIVVQENASS